MVERKKQFQCIYLSLFLLSVTSSFASTKKETCSSVDLQASLGPVRDQGDVGFCAANMAADLLSYRFRDVLNGRKISALDVALHTNRFWVPLLEKKDQFWAKAQNVAAMIIDEGASPIGGLRATQAVGLCVRDLEGIMTAKNESSQLLHQKLAGWMELKKLDQSSSQVALRKRIQELQKIDGLLASLSEDQIVKLVHNNFWYNIPRRISEALCEGQRIAVSKPVWPRALMLIPLIGSRGVDIAMKLMNQQLSLENVVGIGYRAYFLQDDRTWNELLHSKEPLFDKIHSMGEHVFSGHAGVIVGRKWNEESQSCDYLVRNSWGEDCSFYAPSIKERCQKGHFWVAEKRLRDTLLGVVFLPPKK